MRQFGHSAASRWLARGFRLALVGGAVCLVPASTQPGYADDIATSVVDDESLESSVVVEKRVLDDLSLVAEDDAAELQPISTIADKEPQLADPDLAPAATESGKKLPVKVAANTTEVETSAPAGPQPPQPAVFHGIRPGVSTKKQLVDAWGSPDEVAPTESGELVTYNLESFRGVEVLLEDGLVSLLKVQLRTPAAPAELATKIQADLKEAVQVKDSESGHVVAYAFPERGIVMVVDEPDDITPVSTERISQMILQPLEAETFCLRSEGRPYYEFTLRIADLKQATKLAPREAHAHWLLSRCLLEAGRASEAEIEAKRALDIEADNVAYRQQWGATLAAVGKYDTAVLTTREVLDAENAPTLVRAKALHLMGQLAAMGDASIADKAISFQNMAISEADKLATSDNESDRREAKRLLVEAHLDIAIEVSRGQYDDRMDNVAQWVTRASAFAEEMIENDGGDLGLRVRVAQQSLDALSNFKPANDPQPLLKEIDETLEQIKTETSDPLYIDELDWNAGLAYLSALQIEHHRRRPRQALDYSDKAIELLSDLAEDRRDNPLTEQMVGKLYFHIGAVHAVHESAHGEAVEWYDRAIPLLVADAPESELVVPRHEGEALVSMAVSYWDQNDRERAVSLTEEGADLIEQAVSGGVIDKECLAVPYGNLAVMHKKLGNTSESQRYAKLAESVAAKADEAPAQAETKPVAAPKAPGVAASNGPSEPQTAQRTAPSGEQNAATTSPTSKHRKSPTGHTGPTRTLRR